MWLIPLLGAGAIWWRLGERGMVDWAPGLWITVLFGVSVIAYAVLAAVAPRKNRPSFSGPRWVTMVSLRALP